MGEIDQRRRCIKTALHHFTRGKEMDASCRLVYVTSVPLTLMFPSGFLRAKGPGRG